jgi:hypothetical protein
MASFSLRTLVGAVIALGVATVCRPALALIVSDPSPTALINTTAPADDPGWNNALTGFSGIYLGNQWVLTANHVVNPNARPTVANLPGGSYRIIPNSFRTLTNPGSFGGIGLTANSDLLMFRIDTETNTGLKPEQQNPGTKAITIGSSQPVVGAELLMIGAGSTRQTNTNGTDPINFEFHWSSAAAPWPELGTPSSADKHGYKQTGSSGGNTWGKNRVADDAVIQDGNADGNNIIVQLPGGTLLITLATQWDRARNDSGAAIPGSTAVQYEAQAAAGDSGGAVFVKNGANWELVGVMAAIFLDSNQLITQTAYGNRTVFSDLTNSTYRSQIENLRPSTQYSIAGDVNLDGVVTGAVVNGSPTGDLAAFVSGWNNQQGAADIYSWKKGDLNGDGKTDFADFAILRGQLGGSVTAAQLSSLVASASPAANAVPEPNSIAIAAGMGAAWWYLRRRRSS